jgi:hypothetical protein
MTEQKQAEDASIDQEIEKVQTLEKQEETSTKPLPQDEPKEKISSKP